MKPITFSHFVDENRKVVGVNFGGGRVGVSVHIKDLRSAIDGTLIPALRLEALKDAAPVGKDVYDPNNDPVDYEYPTVDLNFTSQESVDVVINALLDVKYRLLLVEKENENAVRQKKTDSTPPEVA